MQHVAHSCSGGAVTAISVVAIISAIAIASASYYFRKKHNHTSSTTGGQKGPASSATSAAFFPGSQATDSQRVEEMPGGAMPAVAVAIRMDHPTDESGMNNEAAIPPNDPNHPFVRALIMRLWADWADAGVPADKQASMEIHILRRIAKLPSDATPADQASTVALALSELADVENVQFPIEPPPPPSASRWAQ
jgi:hypothetical protein